MGDDGNGMVALLRGINVGKAKRVAMADLRAAVEELGCRDVRTLLNSGNVTFRAAGRTPAELETGIEEGVLRRTGVASKVTVLTAAELATVIAEDPLADVADDPTRYLVAVLRDPADRDRLAKLLAADWTPDVARLGGRVGYVWCGAGILGGRLFEALNKALRDGVTTRNWATMLKLHAILSEPGSGA